MFSRRGLEKRGYLLDEDFQGLYKYETSDTGDSLRPQDGVSDWRQIAQIINQHDIQYEEEALARRTSVRGGITSDSAALYFNPAILHKMRRGNRHKPSVINVYHSVDQEIQRRSYNLIELIARLYEIGGLQADPTIGSGAQIPGLWGWHLGGNRTTSDGKQVNLYSSELWNRSPDLYLILQQYADSWPDDWNEDQQHIEDILRDYKAANAISPSWIVQFKDMFKRVGIDFQYGETRLWRALSFWRYLESPTKVQAYKLKNEIEGMLKSNTFEFMGGDVKLGFEDRQELSAVMRDITIVRDGQDKIIDVRMESKKVLEIVEAYQQYKVVMEIIEDLLVESDEARKKALTENLDALLKTLLAQRIASFIEPHNETLGVDKNSPILEHPLTEDLWSMLIEPLNHEVLIDWEGHKKFKDIFDQKGVPTVNILVDRLVLFLREMFIEDVHSAMSIDVRNSPLISIRKDPGEGTMPIRAYQFTALTRLRDIVGGTKDSALSEALEAVVRQAAERFFPDDQQMQRHMMAQGLTPIIRARFREKIPDNAFLESEVQKEVYARVFKNHRKEEGLEIEDVLEGRDADEHSSPVGDDETHRISSLHLLQKIQKGSDEDGAQSSPVMFQFEGSMGKFENNKQIKDLIEQINVQGSQGEIEAVVTLLRTLYEVAPNSKKDIISNEMNRAIILRDGKALMNMFTLDDLNEAKKDSKAKTEKELIQYISESIGVDPSEVLIRIRELGFEEGDLLLDGDVDIEGFREAPEARQLKIAGHSVSLYSNSYIRDKMLPGFYDQILQKLNEFVQDPQKPIYQQTYADVYRIRLRDGYRLYLKLYSKSKDIVILGFDSKGDFSEKSNGNQLRRDVKRYFQKIPADSLDGMRHKLIPFLEKSSSPVGKESVGGIDFNAGLLDLQIKRDGNGVPLPLPLQPIHDMRIEGFLPVIIQITPANVPMLLGFADDEGGSSSDEEEAVAQGVLMDYKRRLPLQEFGPIGRLN